MKEELFFLSSDKETNIHMIISKPKQEPIGIIEMVHGITEHIMKYDEFMDYFTNEGYIVTGIDLIGHGMSTNNGTKRLYFGGEGSWNYLIEDIKTSLLKVKELYPNLKTTLIGFSLGSFIVRTFLYNNSNLVDNVVLAGTGYTNKFILKLAEQITKKESKKIGENVPSAKIHHLVFSTYNRSIKNPKTDFDWLLSDEEELKKYLNDDLIYDSVTPGLLREFIYGMKLSIDKKEIQKIRKDLRILFISGTEDPVGNFTKGIDKVEKIYKKAGINNITKIFMSNMRHDIFHEIDHKKTFAAIKEWI